MLYSQRHVVNVGLRIYSFNIELEDLPVITQPRINDFDVGIISGISYASHWNLIQDAVVPQ